MKEKKKIAAKAPLIAAIVIFACAINVLAVSIMQTHPVDWTTKEKTPEFELYLDDELYPDTTAISFDPVFIDGEPITKTVKVVNVGNIPIQISMTAPDLPDHHTLTLTLLPDTIIGVGAQATGSLTLAAQTDATVGPHSCTITITAEES